MPGSEKDFSESVTGFMDKTAGLIRLDKIVSDTLLVSRSEARNIVRSGRVCVDGSVVTQPQAKAGAAGVKIDGAPADARKHRYFMMDKPAGVVTAAEDRRDGTVMDLVPREYRRLSLFPVGRLDRDTTGLLILTNDGDFAHRVISPKSGIRKKYLAKTEGKLGEEDIKAFADGIVLGDGTRCLPAGLELAGDGYCEVTVSEGKYRQVRRMLASRGAPVIMLRRLSVGGLKIDEKLGPGGIRELSAAEVISVLTD